MRTQAGRDGLELGRRGAARLAGLASVGCAGLMALGVAAMSGAARQPDPGQTIRDMERGRTPATPSSTVPTPVQNPAQTPAAFPGPTGAAEGTSARLLREGTFINARRGRLTRSVTGELLFTMDADGRGRADAAMVLLPCQNLQGMERVVERAGESVTFTVSGQVFVYKGRNFLMPTLFQVNRRPGEVTPAQ